MSRNQKTEYVKSLPSQIVEHTFGYLGPYPSPEDLHAFYGKAPMTQQLALKIAGFVERFLQGSSLPLEDWPWLIEKVFGTWDYEDSTLSFGFASAKDPEKVKNLWECFEEACCGRSLHFYISPTGNGYYFFYNGGH